MAHHPTYTMAGLLTAGGVFGYLKSKSVPSLVAGVTLGAGFGIAGFLLQKGEMTNGHGVALLVSSITTGAMGLRAVRTKKPLPVSVASLGALSAAYHAHRFTEWIGQE
ncbi:Transmembrane protein 14A [Phytophthora pseudosyringae]|uniref:Transmembrane protein 14A n=1 Tax=Phytophthora pseudosyringae TaxID=221518 RepID=A0A8T1W3P0_9STRA|nr:Transmembrane protein 14A [Phytophthora pseudosyringae]